MVGKSLADHCRLHFLGERRILCVDGTPRRRRAMNAKHISIHLLDGKVAERPGVRASFARANSPALIFRLITRESQERRMPSRFRARVGHNDGEGTDGANSPRKGNRSESHVTSDP
jgi:hypothetical protein